MAMGLGVSLMHYVGMSAVHLAGPTWHEPPMSSPRSVSIGASAFALWTLDSRPTRPRLFLGAIALGLAISGMHYTAMAGMRLDPLCFDVSRFVGAESALSRNTLALLATVVAFGVSGAFLLSLVPDRARPKRSRRLGGSIAGRAARRSPRTVWAGTGPKAAVRRAAACRAASSSAPPRSGSRRTDARGKSPSSDIYAVRANAHYTYIHDGEKEYFCTLSISALEARLDPKAFLRVHRSYIVSVDRIARVKRVGRSRHRGTRIAGAVQHPDCARPLSSGQAQDRGARGLRMAPQFMKCVIGR